MSVLVIAEHDNVRLKDSTLSTITAACKLSDDVHVLVIGGIACESVAKKDVAAIHGVTRIILVQHDVYENHLAEPLAKVIHHLHSHYSHILIPSTTFGKNILPRAAALLDMAQVTDVIEIVNENTFKRPIYAGNAIATVQSCDKIKLLTIRTTAFEKAQKSDTNADIEDKLLNVDIMNNHYSEFISLDATASDKPDLTSARVVISGGRGVGSAENFKLLENLADKIGNCAIGASRAAVDAGYVPNDYQVGQTGKIVAPELYIAVGISGAIQHLAGMKDSKIIVAINKDENAPIFEIADYGYVGDLFEAIPKMQELI